MNHIDRQIEEGRLLLDVSEFPNSDVAHFISEKIAEINQGRSGRGLPEIEYTIDEIVGDDAYLTVTEIPLGVGS